MGEYSPLLPKLVGLAVGEGKAEEPRLPVEEEEEELALLCQEDEGSSLTVS